MLGLCSQVMSSIDGLVKEHLPSKAPCLANTRERSDAMMAIYPGRGSRFAKHIGAFAFVCGKGGAVWAWAWVWVWVRLQVRVQMRVWVRVRVWVWEWVWVRMWEWLWVWV
jgi:hypothetical protein